MRASRFAISLIALGVALGITGGVIVLQLVINHMGHKPIWIPIAAALILIGYLLVSRWRKITPEKKITTELDATRHGGRHGPPCCSHGRSGPDPATRTTHL